MENSNEKAIIELTMSVNSLTNTMKEFKDDFKEFRNTDIKIMREEIQALKDWRTQQIGAMNFLRTTWYFLGAAVTGLVIYYLGWKR